MEWKKLISKNRNQRRVREFGAPNQFRKVEDSRRQRRRIAIAKVIEEIKNENIKTHQLQRIFSAWEKEDKEIQLNRIKIDKIMHLKRRMRRDKVKKKIKEKNLLRQLQIKSYEKHKEKVSCNSSDF